MCSIHLSPQKVTRERTRRAGGTRWRSGRSGAADGGQASPPDYRRKTRRMPARKNAPSQITTSRRLIFSGVCRINRKTMRWDEPHFGQALSTALRNHSLLQKRHLCRNGGIGDEVKGKNRRSGSALATARAAAGQRRSQGGVTGTRSSLTPERQLPGWKWRACDLHSSGRGSMEGVGGGFSRWRRYEVSCAGT